MLPIFPDLHRLPEAVFILAGEPSTLRSAVPVGSPVSAAQTEPSRRVWESAGHEIGKTARVELTPAEHGTLAVTLAAGGLPVSRIYLRWRHHFPAGFRFLGDAWERSYGELEWRGASPHRPLPWYFLAHHGRATAGYGVLTGAASIACWLVDRDGVTLELDVRSGGVGVRLGERVLTVATLLQHAGQSGDSPFLVARHFCHAMANGGAAPPASANPPFPARSLCPRVPVVGHNDWYWLYGKNSAAQILEATERMLELCPEKRALYPDGPLAGQPVRPWSVIDDGWQHPGSAAWPGGHTCNGGPWDKPAEAFPDMPALAAQIRALGARPGVWMRPLLTKKRTAKKCLVRRVELPTLPALPNHGVGHTLDPSVPEVLELVRGDVARLRAWGFELIKHDFTTYDITGRWGSQMNAARDRFAPDGWRFADSGRTTAEVIARLYQVIREAAGTPGGEQNVPANGAGLLASDASQLAGDASLLAGDASLLVSSSLQMGEPPPPAATILGCNVVGHLAAGLVEIQRIGDDTSASNWDSTRRMGVNTLAFRLPQHGAFFAADADCVPVSPSIPWRLTQAWLDLVARSGTPLFLSLDPAACGEAEKAGLRDALARAFNPGKDPAEPTDWLETNIPTEWSLQRQTARYQWNEWER